MTTATPSARFVELDLPESLLTTLDDLGYENATPIQAEAIPVLLRGQDVVGIAQTGTGKTAAFALPSLARLDIKLRKPQVLVLCPTRELSLQVAQAYRTYAGQMKGIRVLGVCGGEDMRGQLRSLREGVHVVVATPGRLLDHLQRGSVDLSNTRTVVLDEADEMLRMGFIDDVDTILEKTPNKSTVALFSATMPPRVRDIAERHLKEPQEVTVAAVASTNTNIEQHFWFVKGASKSEALKRLLAIEKTDGVIVFTRTRESTNTLAELLRNSGFKAAALNGDLDQKQRVRTVEQLKSGSLDILVATDVAARGLDVGRITHVFNFDVPFDEEAYVHRIGRTGRAGRQGKAILFVTPREKRMLRNIERLTRQRIPELQLPTREDILARQRQDFVDEIKARVTAKPKAGVPSMIDDLCDAEGFSHRDVAIALAAMLMKGQSIDGSQSARAAAKAEQGTKSSSHQSDDSHSKKNARDRRRERRAANGEAGAGQDLGSAAPLKAHPDVAMERFRMSVGRKHGVQAREIVGAIANEAGIEGEFIGAIQIYDDCSTVDLPEGMPKAILKHLKKTRVKGQHLAMSRLG